jgi:hypothetical protein
MAVATRDLELFVRDALLRGESRPAIEDALARAGGPPAQVGGARGAYPEVAVPGAVARPRPKQ